jgi:hypothetical protein
VLDLERVCLSQNGLKRAKRQPGLVNRDDMLLLGHELVQREDSTDGRVLVEDVLEGIRSYDLDKPIDAQHSHLPIPSHREIHNFRLDVEYRDDVHPLQVKAF